MSLIEVRNISKVFEKKNHKPQQVLSGINFSVKKGECFVIIGPNGSGKSTLLRILGLLEPPTGGEIYYNKKKISNLTNKEKIKYRRKFTFIRQKPVVLNTSVFNNIAYGLSIRGIEDSLIKSKVNKLVDLMELKEFESKNSRKLSGGEMQRVVIAMSFVLDSELYLFDEMFANLDPKNIILLENLITKIKQNKNKTLIISTHDRIEAIKFADRIAVLNEGNLVQIGTPEDIFTSPKDEFTAHFMGYENIFSGNAIINESGLSQIKINDLSIIASTQQEGPVKVCIRPESIMIAKELPKNVSFRNKICGKIKDLKDLGNICHVIVTCLRENFLVTITKQSLSSLGLHIGSEVFINFKATDVKCL